MSMSSDKDRDFWERVDKLYGFARKVLEHQKEEENDEVRYILARFIAAATPTLICDLIKKCRALEKEAQWLAHKLGDSVHCPNGDDDCPDDDIECDKCWREAAREAVENDQ